MPPRQRGLRVLNVAEKPSVAREITRQLGGPNTSRHDSHGMHVSDFPFTLRNTPCQMTVTAVRGHLTNFEFSEQYKNWQAQSPAVLFTAPIQKCVQPDNRDLERNLQQLARQCQWLVLWLDCDREGEAIAFEVVEVCQRATAGRLHVLRATFSALTHADLMRACNTLRPPDQRLAQAVDARAEIDLRTGAAFTRWMTMRYQNKFPALNGKILSYGPCQFPTLGFVVERWLRIRRFVPEPFWSIKMVAFKAGVDVPFSWRRHRLFDRLAVEVLFELCLEASAMPPPPAGNGGAVVTRVAEDPKTRWRPLPLNTIELTKLAVQKLRISPARCMAIAEDLYQRGFLSYPRTETDRFQATIDVNSLVRTQTASTVWGGYATSLVDGGRYTNPRQGTRDDGAHPPIHPVRCAERTELNDEQWRVYELVTRHLLACCSPDARGSRTEVDAVIAEESFVAVGLVVHDRGWLDVYPYSNWTDTLLPNFTVGEVLVLKSLEMTESRTQPPSLLSEADLISLMDQHGIGTDATMHDHIQKIQDREYVTKNADARLEPTTLGAGLIEGYQRFALEEGLDLSKPQLRAQMENGMAAIAQGSLTREDFLTWCLDRTQRCYDALLRNAPALDAVLGQYFVTNNDNGRTAPITQAGFSRCRCGGRLDLRTIAGGNEVGAIPAIGAGAGVAGAGVLGSAPVGRGGRGRAASARGRAAAGRAVGRARGRGATRARSRSAPPSLGAARQQRRRPQQRFLVCSSVGCGVVLSIPSLETQTVRPHQHTCPICNFQVITVRNETNGREHQVCPFCFKNVPRELHPELHELRCFTCLHNGCPLAGGHRSGAGRMALGSSGSSGGPMIALLPCGVCTGRGHIVLRRIGERWCAQCSQHPTCQQTFSFPGFIIAAAVDGRCAACSLRLSCDVLTLSLRLTSGMVLPPSISALTGAAGGDAAGDTIRGVCLGGCSDVVERLSDHRVAS